MDDQTELDHLLARADAVVDAAFQANYRADPVLGSMSKLHGVAQAVTRAHGLLLEQAIAVALRRSGRIEVSRGIRFPITDAAKSLVAANRVETLDRVRLTFDAEARTTFDVDLAAVTVDGAQAWAVDIKRGGGATGGSRRAQVERELRAVKLLLRSFFRQQGYAVDDVHVAVVDVYGQGGFSEGLAVTRESIDAFFDVPVLDVVDALEERLRRRLEDAWAGLAPSIARRPPTCGEAPGTGRAGDADDMPVAPTRTRWADAFAIRPRRAAQARVARDNDPGAAEVSPGPDRGPGRVHPAGANAGRWPRAVA